MSRKRPESIEEKERARILDEFWTMVALLESKDEVKNFFKDLLSPTESVMLARRIQIGKQLLANVPYDKIQLKLKVSPVTIASVHRWIEGGFGGYLTALPKLEQEMIRKSNEIEEKMKEREPFSYEWMRKKYPLHFMLVNLFRDEIPKTPRKLKRN